MIAITLSHWLLVLLLLSVEEKADLSTRASPRTESSEKQIGKMHEKMMRDDERGCFNLIQSLPSLLD